MSGLSSQTCPPVYDTAIIGAGITGCAAAFALARTTARVILLERDDDIAAGATRANSGIVHAGYDPVPGTLMAQYNIEGNAMIRELAPRLRVPFRQNGSLVAALTPEELPTLQKLYERGKENGVPALSLLTGEEAQRLEPNLSAEVCGALHAPTAGVISPWEFALALAQTAVANGCDFRPRCEVSAISREDDVFVLHTPHGVIRSRFIVNAAGCHADEVHDLAAPHAFSIRPVRGEYRLLDKSQGHTVGATVFQCPSAAGKGVLVAPTAHGNLIVGPNAEAADTPDDTAVTAEGLRSVDQQARRSVSDLNLRDTIRCFAGIRAVSDRGDFIVEEAEGCPGFIDLAGIQSPGLTAAPAIAEACVRLLAQAGLHIELRGDFCLLPLPTPFRAMDGEQRAKCVRKNPLYGRVVCRCETVTEAEIVAAIHSPVPARTIDAVKRRCNAGMGRCQGGFCSPRVAAILAREWGVGMDQLEKDRPGSWLLSGRTKEGKPI